MYLDNIRSYTFKNYQILKDNSEIIRYGYIIVKLYSFYYFFSDSNIFLLFFKSDDILLLIYTHVRRSKIFKMHIYLPSSYWKCN
jgi:hypothetical protein